MFVCVCVCGERKEVKEPVNALVRTPNSSATAISVIVCSYMYYLYEKMRCQIRLFVQNRLVGDSHSPDNSNSKYLFCKCLSQFIVYWIAFFFCFIF